MKFFPSFYDKPTNISFSEQEEGEKIALFLRQHAITNVPWITTALVLYLVPLITIKLIPLIYPELPLQFPINLFVAALILWYMFLIAFVITRVIYWYFNIYIVTNIHLVDITLNSLLLNTVTETHIKDIESTRYQFKGIFGALFRFGNVVIETAAKDQDIEFFSVPKPDVVADRIENLEEKGESE